MWSNVKHFVWRYQIAYVWSGKIVLLHLGSIFVPISRNIHQSGLEQTAKFSPGTCATIFLPVCPGAMSACYFGKEATLQTGLFEHKLTQAASLRARWQRRVLPVVEHTPTRPAIKNEGRLRNPDTETARAPRIQPQAPTRHDLIAHVDAFLHTNWRNCDIFKPKFDLFVCLFVLSPR